MHITSLLEIADEKDHSLIRKSVLVTETEKEVQSPLSHKDLQKPDQHPRRSTGVRRPTSRLIGDIWVLISVYVQFEHIRRI